MKKVLYVIGVLFILGIISIVSTYSFTKASAQQISQQSLIDDMTNVLIQQNVPIKTVGLRFEDKIMNETIIDVTVNSISKDDKTAPDDMLNASLISRAANLAQKKGLNVGGIGINFVNTNGITFCRGLEPIRNKELQSSDQFASPFILDDHLVNNLLRSTIDFGKFSLQQLGITYDPNGLRTVTFEIQSPDIAISNKEIMSFILALRVGISDLNLKENCQISAYQVKLTTSGETILNYLFDSLFNRECSWHADSLSATWYSRHSAPLQ
jgi:hypothetical protein